MAECLVRIREKGSDSFYEFAAQFQPGDVLAVNPDFWEWSDRELLNPHWVVIRVDFTPTEVEAFLASESDPLGVKPHKYRRKQNVNMGHQNADFLLSENHTSVVVLTDKQLRDLRRIIRQKGNAADEESTYTPIPRWAG